MYTSFFSQDREVFNLQAKIDEMTREREHLSKENDHIMNEVHWGCTMMFLKHLLIYQFEKISLLRMISCTCT